MVGRIHWVGKGIVAIVSEPLANLPEVRRFAIAGRF